MRKLTCALCEEYFIETGQRVCSNNCSYVNAPKDFQKWVKVKMKLKLVSYDKVRKLFKIIRWGV